MTESREAPCYDAEPTLAAELQAFNDKWSGRVHRLCRIERYPVPFELSVVPAYLRDLGALLQLGLPGAEWLPPGLQDPFGPAAWACWKDLQVWRPGRWTFRCDELLPTVCVLASPPRFGTAAGRYPDQLGWLRDRLAPQTGPVRLLDLACGTGQGTLELARMVADAGRCGSVRGITQAPLEVWMADQRHLPHRPEADFPAVPADVAVEFAVGDLLKVTASLGEPVDVLVCNGLIGGPWFDDDRRFAQLWEHCLQATRPGSLLSFACRFHEGLQPRFEAFLAAAPKSLQPHVLIHGAGFVRCLLPS